MRKQAAGKGIRAIDQGTRYDLTGQMRSAIRAIERGDYGRCKRAVFILLSEEHGEKHVKVMGWGLPGNSEVDAYMIDRAKDRVIG